MWAADNIVHANMLFYPLYYDIASLTNLKTTQAFHLLLDFVLHLVLYLPLNSHLELYISYKLAAVL